MPEEEPKTNATSTGAIVFIGAAVGLVLFAGAVVLGWKFSRPKADPTPIVSATPAPVAPPEHSVVSDKERQEVLSRIDHMPNVTAENKERLYAYVERAHALKRLLTVSFEKGRTKVSEKESARVAKESKQGEFANTARDAAAIFVVLGYADEPGDEKKLLQISTDRATSVMELLRKRCGVQNVVQTVPMGSPKLFDPKDPAENRVVEIWTVLP